MPNLYTAYLLLQNVVADSNRGNIEVSFPQFLQYVGMVSQLMQDTKIENELVLFAVVYIISHCDDC